MSRVIPHRGRGRAVLAASLALAALAAGALQPALADERDDIAQKQDEASAQVSALTEQIEGIDAELAAVYTALEEANAKIPVAQEALDEATSRRDAADRAHEIALGQLDAAKAEQTRLDEEIAEAEAKQEAANGAIGDLARRMYKNGSDSPVVVALTKSGTESIDQRAQAAEAMARSQSQALNAALDVKATQRTQASRLEAVTNRIAALEEAAKNALEEAEAARADAAAGLVALETAKADAEAKQAEWNTRKAEANEQLDAAQAEFDKMSAALAKIDAENAAKQRVYVSSSGFTFPLRVPMVVTSSYGYRLHPVVGVYKLHNGTDFAATCGTPIYPAAAGEVIAVTVEAAGGNVVYVNHGMMNGASMSTAYVHLQSVSVSVGQRVSTSSVLGTVGDTGYATGCHLHWSVMVNGETVDPMGYL